jgi:drug/metabolite transporter (DMT)-like permease
VIIALVLLSAFLHATWNALLRLEQDKDRSLIVAILVATWFAATVAGVRWSLGAVPFASLGGLGETLLAGAFEAIYFATLARAMDRGKLGVVYTISRGGAVLAVWPLSTVLFAELVTWPAVAGSLLVLAGLAISGLGSGRNSQGNRSGAVGWAVACAVSIAGYHLAYKAALRDGVNPSACFALSLGISAVINLGRLGRTGRRELGALARGRWPRLVVMGLVCGGSFLILMEALAIGGSGYVLTLRNTSVLFAADMAWWIGERPARIEIAGAVLVAAGAALMAW